MLKGLLETSIGPKYGFNRSPVGVDVSIETEVLAAMQAHVAARMSNDTDAVLNSYSDEWADSKGYTKQTLNDWHLASVIGSAKLEITIDLRTVEVVVDGSKAIISPILTDSAKGRISHKHHLKKESDGVWRLTYTETVDWELRSMDEDMQALKDAIDATAMVVREHREQLLNDRWRPGYHFVVPEGVAAPFDPNGAIYWKGRYHLFYIFQDKRSGKKADHWGHISSTDLFHWRHHPTGLLDGMYSGNCFLNEHGVPTICYHQVGLGNALAVALDDDLDEWEKLATNPITPPPKADAQNQEKYRSWDPFAWYENGFYYAIFGGEHPAIAKSPAMGGDWRYVGDLFAHEIDGVSLNEDVSCAELFRLGDKDILLCISHRMGCRYYVGEWKDEQFYPDIHAQMSWRDNIFFAPESLEDDQGRRIMWAWLLDLRDLGTRFDAGWSGVMSLPRVISLGDDRGEEGRLRIEVAEEIERLRYRPHHLESIEVDANAEVVVAGVSGDSLELIVDMESANATEFGIKVCVSPDGEEQTVISFDPLERTLSIDTRLSGPADSPKDIETAPFSLEKNEPLRLRVFIDKSVVEVFANDRQALVRRIYPARTDSLGVRVFAVGGGAAVRALQSWHISPSNPY